MPKPRDAFICRSCGGVQSRWVGKCPDCGAWGSLEHERIDRSAERDPQRGLIEGWQPRTRPLAEGEQPAPDTHASPATASPEAMPINALHNADAPPPSRLRSGIAELDRVLGGGLVPGSAVLVGGDPGIGKSTMMLQLAGALASAGDNGQRVLYVSSEESAEQVRMRAARLGVADRDRLFVLSDTNLARIVEQTRRTEPAVLIIDSVQMVYKADLDASPGSVSQLRRCCAELVYLAKLSGTAVVLVGHVTKDGQLAGPRLLEHLVDAVLYFEGDRYHAHRVLRAVKNRFGTTLEIGVFEMTGAGLAEVPAGAGPGVLEDFAPDARPKPGSVICPALTGTRCMLVEIQALTATGFLGAAKRKNSGIDSNRLAMIIAVLEQHAGLRLADRDIFVSSVGGIRVAEPAADLPLLLAIAGAFHRRALPPATVAVGEVGLGGEIRPVPQLEQRIAESLRLGAKRVLVPAAPATKNAKQRQGVVPLRSVTQAIEELN
ncbi:MAG: DNA repair protein RadA [Phycisphaeraceae bacterium]|nr:DNA repair protein RadA [Phycisphaeraceae bacterium]